MKKRRQSIRAAGALAGSLQQTPAWAHKYRRDFTGGENLKLLPEFLQPNQVIAAHNCVITDEGILSTRPGKTPFCVSLGEGPIISLHRYSKEDGSKYVLAQHGTSLYVAEWDGVNTAAALEPGAAAKVGLATAKLRSLVWKDKLFLFNGVDPLFCFDGAAFTDIAAAPVCEIMGIYGSRMWGVVGNILWYSDVETYGTWPMLDAIKVRDGDGDTITAICPMDGGLLIFKQRSTWVLYGTSKASFKLTTAPIAETGCVGPDAMLSVGLMMGFDNLYTFSLNGVQELPQTHTPVFAAMTEEQKAATVAIAYRKGRTALFHLMNGDEQRCLCIHEKYKGAITSWFDLSPACFCVADDHGDAGHLLIGDAFEGIIYVLDNMADDAGAPIHTYVKDQADDMGLPGRDKVWRFIKVDLEMYNNEEWAVGLAYDLDIGEETEGITVPAHDQRAWIWDVSEWDGIAQWDFLKRVRDPFWFTARGRKISFEIETDNRIKLLGFNTRFRPAGEE